VDDDPSICQILTKILHNQGYNPLVSSTCAETLNTIKNERVDLILLDIMLPDGDGIELAKKIIQNNQQLPIILITAHGTIERAVKATKYGVYDFFEKPFHRERLIITIRNALSWSTAREELHQLKADSLARYKMVGESKEIQHVYELIDKIAPNKSNVLVLGPSGSGKELVARAIHLKSPRSSKRMVKINCSSMPDSLIESELFGHTKGAFTGAYTTRPGKFETADKGTLFLDEIGDLSPAAQAKMLRVLETGEIQRVGSDTVQEVDVRIIAATHKNLEQMVKEGTFRDDLYYRINVFSIYVPSLTERKSDIPLLLIHFGETLAEESGTVAPHFTKAALNFLSGYPWPGNIRQLHHFMERTLVFNDNGVIDLEHCKQFLNESQNRTTMTGHNGTLKEAKLNFEKHYIEKTIVTHGGNITKAAKALGMDRANLYRKMKELGIK